MHYNTPYVDEHSMTKIALVDDHMLFREGLAKVIDEFENYKVIIKAQNGQDFMDHIDPDNLPDIVLLDLNMPSMNGYDNASLLISLSIVCSSHCFHYTVKSSFVIVYNSYNKWI